MTDGMPEADRLRQQRDNHGIEWKNLSLTTFILVLSMVWRGVHVGHYHAEGTI
jgi:hypothetical protein